MISSNQQILIVIIIGIVIIFLLYNRSEDFATTSESIANLASMYNASTLTANNINTTDTINAKLINAKSMYTDILDAKTMQTAGINTGTSTAEGGRIDISNYSKAGEDISKWSIYNMTGGYGKGLNFWRYKADGANPGPSVIFKDSGDVIMKNNLDICGNLTINGMDIRRILPGVRFYRNGGGANDNIPDRHISGYNIGLVPGNYMEGLGDYGGPNGGGWVFMLVYPGYKVTIWKGQHVTGMSSVVTNSGNLPLLINLQYMSIISTTSGITGLFLTDNSKFTISSTGDFLNPHTAKVELFNG
jgi:hypothetical protein